MSSLADLSVSIPKSISVGTYGGRKFILINPIVLENGNIYYLVDGNGDGVNSRQAGKIGTYYLDAISHDFLDQVLNGGADTLSTQSNGLQYGIDDERTIVLNGYTIALPTVSEWLKDFNQWNSAEGRKSQLYLNGKLYIQDVEFWNTPDWSLANYVWLADRIGAGNHAVGSIQGAASTELNPFLGDGVSNSIFGAVRVIFSAGSLPTNGPSSFRVEPNSQN
jgi:hypothetical protein